MLKFVLLGLLAKQAQHGYELKRNFETLFGGTWTLNVGQVYTTLTRLERDGFVTAAVVEQRVAPDRRVYALTPAGHDQLQQWLDEEVDEPIPLKDDVFAKIVVHRLIGGGDAQALLWRQRQVYLRKLGELSRLQAEPAIDSTTALLLEGAVLHVEADLKWLDVAERHLAEDTG